MYVFGQKEVVYQTLSDTTPFALIPYSYTGGRGERFTVKLERRLPFRRDLGGGRCVRPGLGRWLSDNDTPRWPWKSSHRRLSGRPKFAQLYAIFSESGLKKVEEEEGVLDLCLGTLATTGFAGRQVQNDQSS